MLKKLLLASTLLAPTSASAVTVTIGFFEESSGQIQVTPLFNTGEGFFSTGTSGIYQYTGNWGGELLWSANSVTNVYMFEATDIFNTVGDTIRFYATFSGITTPAPQLNIPTYFEGQTQPGATVVDQVFTCPVGATTFCDNYPGLGNLGTGVGSHSFTSTGDLNTTLSAIAPGSPYNITLVLHFASSLNTTDDLIDLGAVNLVNPDPPVPAPGPEVGAGLPGLLGLLGMWWYRRQRDATRLISPH